MTYGWSIEYINQLTWPMISKLFERIKDHPPADLILSEVFRQKNVPIESQIAQIGVPIKKGKVLRKK